MVSLIIICRLKVVAHATGIVEDECRKEGQAYFNQQTGNMWLSYFELCMVAIVYTSRKLFIKVTKISLWLNMDTGALPIQKAFLQMIRTFTKTVLAVLCACSVQSLSAQTIITRWNFNSNPPDASTSTGSTAPATGSGNLITIGGVTQTFATGTSGNGSSDPATDNTGLNLTGWPTQGTANKTAGISFTTATTGYEDIIVTFDLRHSNTGPADLQFQYCTDITATTPAWIDFATSTATLGDNWYARSYDLSAVAALENNANAGFRVVAAFAASTTTYNPSASTSTYGTGGTWRFDMVTVKGTQVTPGDVTAPVASLFKVTSPTTSFIKFNEPLLASSVSSLSNYAFSPALAVTAAALNTGGDTIFLTHATIVNGQSYTVNISGVKDLAGNTMATIPFNTVFNGALPQLVITEFAHSPNTMEFIEVYNAGSTSVNLNGLKWTDGTGGDFPDLTLAAGANILFSTNPTSAASLMGGIYYTITNGLSATNDVLVIRNTLDQAIDSVDYYVGTNGWPAAVTGIYGYSFELNSATNNNNLGNNWSVPANTISSPNGTIRATPGVYPPVPPSPAPQILSYKQLSATSTRIVFNQAVSSASASTVSHYTFSPALAVTAATPAATNDTVILTHQPLVNGVPYTLSVSGVVNGSNVTNTPASLDFIWNQSVPALVITEIIHSPNDIEMIEVYNNSGAPINLGGLKWTDGTTGNFPAISLPADSTIVFATAPGTAAATLLVDTVFTINNGLGSSNDVLVIRNSLDQVIDSVDYYVGTNGWPAAPTGTYGYSFELNNASNNNNLGSNWTVPFNTITPQPAQGIIRATPGVYPAPTVTPSSATVNFVGTKANINENGVQVYVVANLTGGNTLPSSIDLQLVPMGTATSGTDFVIPASLQYNWVANANNVNDTITFTINNDAIPENTEYFILRMVNPANVTPPAASSNNFTIFIADDDLQAPAASQSLTLSYLSSLSNGTAGTNSAEIVAHDPLSQRLYIANSVGAKIDIVNFSNPAAPTVIYSIPVTPYGNINSLTVRNGIVAAAIENSVPESPGKVVFLDSNGVFISQVNVGAMPDMITFNHAGTKVFTANEGQPNNAYTVDPEGSVSIIDISGGVASVSQSNVTTASFASYNSQAAALKATGIRIFGPGATVAQDMEPEYITISADDQTAWVTCQENNAIATIDIATSTVTALRPLGTKDHMLTNNALDANDQGGVIQIANWPVKGEYMPDAIASFVVGGQTYLITANEGDSREYNGYSEVKRVGDATYTLDPVAFPYPEIIKANLGRLNISTASGDTDGDGDFDEIHAYGGRSVSIWNATTGALVWDSGDNMELMLSKHPVYSTIFNASNANNTLKNRSDDKGPEPEGVTVATINNKIYAFVALERMGGCMVYDITNPAAPVFTDYKNSRTIASYGGDQGAEGIVYISAANAPNGVPVVILANEVSSTLSFFQVQDNTPLSVQLDNIDAINVNGQNKVSWKSAAEKPGDIYELEKSGDGNHFMKLGTVAAMGQPQTYHYFDQQPLTGWNYYRLKVITATETSYSKVVKAYQDANATLAVQVFPNPAAEVLNISVNQFDSYADIELQDIKGATVVKKKMLQPIDQISMKDLPTGLYILKFKNENNLKTIKIIKR